jgi:hypothetical protein
MSPSIPQAQPSTSVLTAGPAAHYPLYYYVPSITHDGRWMVVHRELDGDVQLARLDLHSGALDVFTRGRGQRCGWAMWCREDTGGIFAHLSCMDPGQGRAFWFEDGPGGQGDMEVWAGALSDLSRVRIARLPGRIPVGQSACSPDGRWLALLHAEHDFWRGRIAGRDRVLPDHEVWRAGTAVEAGLIDTLTGTYRRVAALDFHVHHVLFADASHLLLNHLPDGNGMWVLPLEGGLRERRVLRPPDDHGRVCHQQVTPRGIFYEVFNAWTGDHPTRAGLCEWPSGRCREFALPLHGYTHIGRDPEGRRWFFEVAGKEYHYLYSLEGDLCAGEAPSARILCKLPPYPGHGQRYHAHPFLGPDSRLHFTTVVAGHPQVARLQVRF